MTKKQKTVPISEVPENKQKTSPNYPFQNRGGLCIWDSVATEPFLV